MTTKEIKKRNQVSIIAAFICIFTAYFICAEITFWRDHQKVNWEWYDAPTGLYERSSDLGYMKAIVTTIDTKDTVRIDTVRIKSDWIYDIDGETYLESINTYVTYEVLHFYKEITERKKRRIKYTTK